MKILHDIFIVYVSKPTDHEPSKVDLNVSCGLPVMSSQCEAICITKGGTVVEGVDIGFISYCSVAVIKISLPKPTEEERGFLGLQPRREGVASGSQSSTERSHLNHTQEAGRTNYKWDKNRSVQSPP